VRRFLAVVAIGGALLCLGGAFNAISLSTDEKADVIVYQLPEEAFLKYRLIGDVYGSHAAEYWRYVIYERAPEHWEEIKGTAAAFPTILEELGKQVQGATATEFRVSPSDARVGAILKEYDGIEARAPELIRRLSFAQRFKDTMAYIGGATLLGAAGWMLWGSPGRPRQTP
jgi:hypothetical protein